MLEVEIFFADKKAEKSEGIKGAPEGRAPLDLSALRIVVVEDEFFVAWHLQTMLRELNFNFCEIASDAQSAVDCAVDTEADLLLMDVNLGGGPDGIEAVRRIQEYRQAAVIFITAYIDDITIDRIRRLAPKAPILSKPVSPDLLRKTIAQLFPREH